MKSEYDILIVGGGPAGSSAAIRLAHLGLSVALFEKAAFPRPKLCGEFISPECLRHFEELGVAGAITSNGEPIERTVFHTLGGRHFAIESTLFDKVEARGLSRAMMDDVLLDRAINVGVDVFENTGVRDLLLTNGKVEGITKDTGETVRSKLAVDATGRGRVLTKRFEQAKPRKPSHVAFKAHLSGVQIDEKACEIFAYRGGYGGCNAVENGLHNVCFIVSAAQARNFGGPDGAFQKVLMTNPRAADVLANGRVETEWLAVPITRYGRGNVSPAPGLVAVGDAGSFIDPFTGSGMLLALESSEVLAEAVTSGFHGVETTYKELYANRFGRRLRFVRLLRGAAFAPVLADSVASILSISSTARWLVATLTRGKVDSLTRPRLESD